MFKKLILISLFFNSSIFCIHETLLRTLTKEEKNCLKWFEQTKTKINYGFKNLSYEDKNIFKKGISYNQNPDDIKRVIQNFVSGFYKHTQEYPIVLEYDQETINSILLKIKDYIAARMFVFSQLLTDEERLTIKRNNYLENPEAALNVIKKNGELLANELVRINLISDEDKEQIANQFVKEKIEELEAAYK